MARDHTSKSVRRWEETLVADYYDYRCRALLEPLYEQFQQWNDGDLDHETILDAIHQAHKANRERYLFFAQSRSDLARFIQLDPWFQEWVKTHPTPEGAGLAADASPQHNAAQHSADDVGKAED